MPPFHVSELNACIGLHLWSSTCVTFSARIIIRNWITLVKFDEACSYEVTHCEIFSNFLSPPHIQPQTFPSAPCLQTPSACVLPSCISTDNIVTELAEHADYSVAFGWSWTEGKHLLTLRLYFSYKSLEMWEKHESWVACGLSSVTDIR